MEPGPCFSARRSDSSASGRARNRRNSGSTHSIRQPWQPLSASHPAFRAAAPVRTEHMDMMSGRGSLTCRSFRLRSLARIRRGWRARVATAPVSAPLRSSPTPATAHLSTVRQGSLAIRAAACSRNTVLRRTDASTRGRCTYTLGRGAFRAPCPLYPETTPPELLGGAAEGIGAVLMAAGGGENAVTGTSVAAFPFGRRDLL